MILFLEKGAGNSEKEFCFLRKQTFLTLKEAKLAKMAEFLLTLPPHQPTRGIHFKSIQKLLKHPQQYKTKQNLAKNQDKTK